MHRDVKPQNVLLNGDGRAKVTDFGIARSLDVQHGMTQTGTVLGTSDYIAPEQAQGQRVDEHTDVYSLGVVLYELLTSEVPFPGENFVAVAMRHINEPPPLDPRQAPGRAAAVEAAVQRAMAKRPSDRFRRWPTSATSSRRASTRSAAGGTPPSPPSCPPWGRRGERGGASGPRSLLLAALAGAAALLAYAISQRDDGGNGTGRPRGRARRRSRARSARPDPFGDRTEHDAFARRATDGDPATYWTTRRTTPALPASTRKASASCSTRVVPCASAGSASSPTPPGTPRRSAPARRGRRSRDAGVPAAGSAADADRPRRRRRAPLLPDLDHRSRSGYEIAHVNEVSVAA